MDDLISRQALCDDLREYKVHPVPVSSDESEVKGYNDGIDLAISVIAEFPSAEPERLTDKEQRIFLAAMGREEKICKQVEDDEYRDCREPYEDSLVRTCHEIIRKVKGALWMT